MEPFVFLGICFLETSHLDHQLNPAISMKIKHVFALWDCMEVLADQLIEYEVSYAFAFY